MTSEYDRLALTARNSSVEDMVALLRGQQARKVDVVAPATAIRVESGPIVLDQTDRPHDHRRRGTMTAGAYRPTDVCDGGITEKLGIPMAYLRRMRESRPKLYDQKVNGWLTADEQTFVVRYLRSENGGIGVARARLSDGYKTTDRRPPATDVARGGLRAEGPAVPARCRRSCNSSVLRATRDLRRHRGTGIRRQPTPLDTMDFAPPGFSPRYSPQNALS